MKHWKPAVVLASLLLTLNSSLTLAHYTHSLTIDRWVFLWVLVVLSDTVGAAFMFTKVMTLYATRNPFAKYLAFLLGGIAIESMCCLLANVYPPEIKEFTLWYTCWFWSGRMIKSFSVWMILLFITGVLNGVSRPAPIKS